jgi:hypothetical protein
MNHLLTISTKFEAQNDILIAPFYIEEVREAIFYMEHNKAPVPDGFPVKFYQVF